MGGPGRDRVVRRGGRRHGGLRGRGGDGRTAGRTAGGGSRPTARPALVGTVYVLAVAGLITGAGLHLTLAVLAGMAMMAGASIPQVGALSAARWRHTVRTPDQVAAALSLEAALNDVTFLCGPVLVTTLSTVLYPAAGLTLAGASWPSG